jgi:Tfp pilus assembly protein PilW
LYSDVDNKLAKKNIAQPKLCAASRVLMMGINTKGFSLVEFMVALVISVLFGIVTVTLLNHSTRHVSTVKDVADMSKTSRTSLFLMARDIANTGYMLNCVGRSCGSILSVPSVVPTTGVGAISPCYFSGTTGPACQVLTYTTSPVTLTLNYAALAASDSIQIKYSIDNTPGPSSLRREQIFANSTTYPKSDTYVASNVIQMALQFGLDTGTCPTSSGTVSYSNTMIATDVCKLRSIKIALLTRSELPDKKYVSPATIPWVDTVWAGGATGGIYTVPANPDQSHYRFKVVQEEIYLINPTITNP